MCFNVASSFFGVTVIAACQRHTRFDGAGRAHRADYGGKLCRVGSGWIALGGESTLAVPALERLVASGIDAADISAVGACFSAVAPRRTPTKGDACLVAGRGEVATVGYAGEIKNRGAETLIVQYPREYEDAPAAYAAFNAALSGVASFWDLVRAVAAEYVTVAARSDAVSPTVEIGLGNGYIVGAAAELASMPDADLRGQLRPPPAVCFHTLTRMQRENAA